MSGGVFISYRREDSGPWAKLVHGRLVSELGRESVFIDVDNIPPGLDFVDVLTERVSSCYALVAVIGKLWISAADKDNRRRLDDLRDFVRIEIEAALKRGIRVIPALIDGAAMPKPEDLPDSLKKLASMQYVEISLTQFNTDVEVLTSALASLKRELRWHRVTTKLVEGVQTTKDGVIGLLNTKIVFGQNVAPSVQAPTDSEQSSGGVGGWFEKARSWVPETARRLMEIESARADEERRGLEAALADRAAREARLRAEAEAAENAKRAHPSAGPEPPRADEEGCTQEAGPAGRAAREQQKRVETTEAADRVERRDKQPRPKRAGGAGRSRGGVPPGGRHPSNRGR